MWLDKLKELTEEQSMIRFVMMELEFEPILVWYSPGNRNLVSCEFSPNFNYPTCRDLLKPPSSIITRSALPNLFDSSNMDVNYLRNLPRSGLIRLLSRGMLVRSRGLLIRSWSILVMHWHSLRWPFSSSCPIVETHQRSSSQSNHRESDELHNHNMLVNSETTEGNDMPRGRASAKESRQFKDSETSSHKRKSQEKETHFEQQSTAIPNGTPKRQAVNRASRYSSCLSSITEHDAMDSTHMGAQPSVESISTQPLSSFYSVENVKLLFDYLIALHLEDLSDPEKETSMKQTLSILADNLSLFSEEQGEQLLELLFDFPALVHRWREYSRSHKDSQKSSAETEKIRDLVKTSLKDEESLKLRYEELEKKEKELMRQLEAVQKEKAEIAEQRTEKSNQTKEFMEKAAHRKKDERLMRIAATKLNNLSDQWAKLQSVFI